MGRAGWSTCDRGDRRPEGVDVSSAAIERQRARHTAGPQPRARGHLGGAYAQRRYVESPIHTYDRTISCESFSLLFDSLFPRNIISDTAASGVVVGRGGASELFDDAVEEGGADGADVLDDLDEFDDVDEEELRRLAPETTGDAPSAPEPPPKRDMSPRDDAERRFNLRPRIDGEAVRLMSFLYDSVAPDLSFSSAATSASKSLSPVQWRRALAALATLADVYLARYTSSEREDTALLMISGAETLASSSGTEAEGGAARAGGTRATLHAASGVAAATAASMRVRHEVAVKMRRGEKKTLLWLRSVAWNGLPRAAVGVVHDRRASAETSCASTLHPAQCAERRRFERIERELFDALAQQRAGAGAYASPATWGTAPGAPGEGRVVFVTFNVTEGGASAGDLGAALRAALQGLDAAGDLAGEVAAGLRNLASMLSGGGAQLILPGGSGAGEGGSCGAPPPQLSGAPLGLGLPGGGAAPTPPADEVQRAAAADPRYKRAYCVEGARIRGNWRGQGRFYPGHIGAVHAACIRAAPAPSEPEPAARGSTVGSARCCAFEALDGRLIRFDNCERDDTPPGWVQVRVPFVFVVVFVLFISCFVANFCFVFSASLRSSAPRRCAPLSTRTASPGALRGTHLMGLSTLSTTMATSRTGSPFSGSGARRAPSPVKISCSRAARQRPRMPPARRRWRGRFQCRERAKVPPRLHAPRGGGRRAPRSARQRHAQTRACPRWRARRSATL